MIRVGVGGWTYEPWRGTFYPDGMKHADELRYAGSKLTSIVNPQNAASSWKGAAGTISHLGPRAARAGEAVTTPPNMPSSAPSATIVPVHVINLVARMADPHRWKVGRRKVEALIPSP